MRFHYDLCGAEAVIRDVPVYDATSIAAGELLKLELLLLAVEQMQVLHMYLLMFQILLLKR